jgi:hypothetical protein
MENFYAHTVLYRKPLAVNGKGHIVLIHWQRGEYSSCRDHAAAVIFLQYLIKLKV